MTNPRFDFPFSIIVSIKSQTKNTAQLSKSIRRRWIKKIAISFFYFRKNYALDFTYVRSLICCRNWTENFSPSRHFRLQMRQIYFIHYYRTISSSNFSLIISDPLPQFSLLCSVVKEPSSTKTNAAATWSTSLRLAPYNFLFLWSSWIAWDLRVGKIYKWTFLTSSPSQLSYILKIKNARKHGNEAWKERKRKFIFSQ